MIVHLYSQCWNDEEMLPFFFRHYDPIVDRYVMYDDGSEDASLSILASHPRVRVERHPRQVPGSFVLSQKALLDTCWKASRGAADWVIVTDIDEHLCHPDLAGYLQRCKAEGVTLIPALGFQMISDEPPSPTAVLCRDYPMGAPWIQMMKASIFDPDAIEETDYTPGRHRATPSGRILLPAEEELLLLHYKYLGFQHTHARHGLLLRGLGPVDHAQRFGHKYSWSEEQLRADWEAVRASAIDTREVGAHPSRSYPFEPWWAGYPRVAAGAGGA